MRLSLTQRTLFGQVSSRYCWLHIVRSAASSQTAPVAYVHVPCVPRWAARKRALIMRLATSSSPPNRPAAVVIFDVVVVVVAAQSPPSPVAGLAVATDRTFVDIALKRAR